MNDLESQRKVLQQKTHYIGGRACQVKVPFTKVLKFLSSFLYSWGDKIVSMRPGVKFQTLIHTHRRPWLGWASLSR